MFTKWEDTYRHKGMRRALVREVQGKGIADARVLEAIGKVPRHYFFDPAFVEHAYQDKAFPIGAGQTISQPYTVAFQTEILRAKAGQKVLEIGTGSGYQACVLLELGVRLYTIEYQPTLAKRAKGMLERMGYKAQFVQGDGSQGLPLHAPFDGILVTAGAPTVPQALIDQLAIGGRLVIPVGNADVQKMLAFTKVGPQTLEKEEHHQFRFVPLLGKNGWK